MAGTVAKLAVELALKHGRYSAGIDASKKKTKQLGDSADSTGMRLAKMAKSMLAVAGVGGAVAFVKANLKAIDSLGKTSDKLGIGVEKLQAYRLAAEQMAGFSSGQFDMALQRMTRRLAEAENGTGEAVKALTGLGLSIDDIAGKSPDEQMKVIADAMTGVSSEAQQLAIAFKLFDTEGAALVNMLRKGSVGLEDFEEKAKSLGLTITRTQIADVEAANDAWSTLWTSLKGLGQHITVKLAPVILEGAEALNELTGSAVRFDDQMRRISSARTFEDLSLDIASLGVAVEKARADSDFDALFANMSKQDKLAREMVQSLEALVSSEEDATMSLATFHRTTSQQLSAQNEWVGVTRNSAKAMTALGELLALYNIDLDVADKTTTDLNNKNLTWVDSTVKVSDALSALRTKLMEIDQAATSADMGRSRLDEYSARIDMTREKIIASIEEIGAAQGVATALSEERLALDYATQLQGLQSARENQLLTLQFYQENERAIIDNHLLSIEAQEKASALRNEALWNASWANKAAMMGSALSGMASLMQSENRAMFEVGKVAAYSETVFSTYSAAQKQFETFSYNPPLAYAAAASAVAAGLMRAQAIKNTSFGGGAAATAQMSSSVDSMSGGGDSSNTARPSQELVVQGGGMVSVDSLEQIFRDAREQNIDIVGVRGG